MSELHEGDIVKLSSEETTKLGLIKEVESDTIVRIGENWYDLDEYELEVLHSEG